MSRARTKPSRKLTVASAALAVVVCAPIYARAADPPPDGARAAAALKTQGDEAMDSLRYEEALDAYAKAYELGHDPAVLYNRGRVYQARGDFPRALDDLERFEREAPASLRQRVPRLGELIADVRAKVVTLTIHANVTGARVLVRGVDLGKTPLEGARVNPGHAMIEVLADGYTPAHREVDLEGGVTRVVDLVLAPPETQSVLSLTAAGAPGTVFVDGTPVGSTPVEVVRPAGSHRIVLRREGQGDLETSVVLAPGTRKDYAFPAPRNNAVTGKWWFWTVVGGAVLGGVATVVILTRPKSADSGEGFSPNRVSAPLVRW